MVGERERIKVGEGMVGKRGRRRENHSRGRGGGEEGEGWKSSDRGMTNGSSVKSVTKNS